MTRRDLIPAHTPAHASMHRCPLADADVQSHLHAGVAVPLHVESQLICGILGELLSCRTACSVSGVFVRTSCVTTRPPTWMCSCMRNDTGAPSGSGYRRISCRRGRSSRVKPDALRRGAPDCCVTQALIERQVDAIHKYVNNRPNMDALWRAIASRNTLQEHFACSMRRGQTKLEESDSEAEFWHDFEEEGSDLEVDVEAAQLLPRVPRVGAGISAQGSRAPLFPFPSSELQVTAHENPSPAVERSALEICIRHLGGSREDGVDLEPDCCCHESG